MMENEETNAKSKKGNNMDDIVIKTLDSTSFKNSIENVSKSLLKLALTGDYYNLDTIKPIENVIKNYNKAIVKAVTESEEKILNLSKIMMDSINKVYPSIIKNVNYIANTMISTTKQLHKNIALKLLNNGFYPSHVFDEIAIDLLKKDTIKNFEMKCSNKILKEKEKYINKLKKLEPKHKRKINEINKLFKERKYRLYILSTENLICIISNEMLGRIDLFDRGHRTSKLIEKGIMKRDEDDYILFAPYIENIKLEFSDELATSHIKDPKNYKSYNRNAIIHGYISDFGTRINCIRWLSVLFNLTDLVEKYEKSYKQ